MTTIIADMQNALDMAGGSVGLTALFLAGLIALWYGKFGEERVASVLFWYSLLTLAMAINPLYIGFVRKYLPNLYNNNIYLWVIPVMPVIIYSGVMAALRLKERNQKVVFSISVIGVLLLAAMTSYSQSDVNVAEQGYIERDKKDIFVFITEELERNNKEYCLIWGENEVMAHARVVDGRVHTLYGKDLWENQTKEPESDEFVQKDEKYENYTLMQSPGINSTFIAERAKKYGCDYIIISEKSFVSCGFIVPEVIGSYYLEYTDSYYLVYKYLSYED